VRALSRLAALLAATGAVALSAAPLAAAPRVVASIFPVQALVAEIMDGVAEPALLIRPGSTPHGYQMRPSDSAALNDADLIVWVGPSLETFLVRPLAALGDEARIVELLDAAGVTLLEARQGGVWGSGHAIGGHDHDRDHGSIDPHIWLSPANARAMADAVAVALAEIDPDNAASYAANAKATGARLSELEEELRQVLGPVRDRPFVVAHDAYQYLEHAFGLTAVGAITISPDRQPGARRLVELRETLLERGVVCILTEPQLPSGLADVLVEGTSIGTAVLDPEGTSAWQGGEGTYLQLMRLNARAMAECLARDG
jgi:zinc transport system substrate-binding protein